jgi:hypothetical protein
MTGGGIWVWKDFSLLNVYLTSASRGKCCLCVDTIEGDVEREESIETLPGVGCAVLPCLSSFSQNP